MGSLFLLPRFLRLKLEKYSLKRLKQGRLKSALADVEKVIESNPHHSRSLAIKADVLFQQCNFEHALMFFDRGLQVTFYHNLAKLDLRFLETIGLTLKAIRTYNLLHSKSFVFLYLCKP